MSSFIVKDVYNISGIGIVITGNVGRGVVKIGMKLNLEGKVLKVENIEFEHKKVEEAVSGQDVGIILKFVSGDKPTSSKILSSFFRNLYKAYDLHKIEDLMNKYKGKEINFSDS